MAADTLLVRRAELDLEEPWATPPVCTPVRLRRAVDAAAPRLSTTVAAFFDDRYLSILFSGADDHLQATHLTHDAPLYEEDVVEVLVAPDRLTRYYEIEVSPRGTVFDARIDSPDGLRATMSVDRGWSCDGLVVAVRRQTVAEGMTTLETLLRIPFVALDRGVPADGETWRCNFFRIDRHPTHGDEFTAWQPTMKMPPDFHVAAAFGGAKFVRG